VLYNSAIRVWPHFLAIVLVGTQPDCYESRACKRRPKPYPLLRGPRAASPRTLGTGRLRHSKRHSSLPPNFYCRQLQIPLALHQQCV